MAPPRDPFCCKRRRLSEVEGGTVAFVLCRSKIIIKRKTTKISESPTTDLGVLERRMPLLLSYFSKAVWSATNVPSAPTTIRDNVDPPVITKFCSFPCNVSIPALTTNAICGHSNEQICPGEHSSVTSLVSSMVIDAVPHVASS